jgi:hypothetical protein
MNGPNKSELTGHFADVHRVFQFCIQVCCRRSRQCAVSLLTWRVCISPTLANQDNIVNNPSSAVEETRGRTSLRLGLQEEAVGGVGTRCRTRSKAQVLLLLPLKTRTAASCYLARPRLQTNKNKCKLPGSISFVINSREQRLLAPGRAYCTAPPAYRSGVPRLLAARLDSSPPATVIFVFHISAWELLQLKRACLIGGKPPQNINDRCDLQIKRIL